MLKRLLFVVLLALASVAQGAVYSLPWGPKPQFVDANGAPMSGGTVSTFLATSTTPQVTYTDSTGGTANPTTITLNTRGESPNEVWLTGGVSYKFILKDSAGATVWSVDGVSGVNDVSASVSEWVAGPTPTFVSATSFTLAGDQTPTFRVGRRVKTTNSGGTVYSRITASVFGASTTVTVINDSSALDSGLSAVSYGLLDPLNVSIPFSKGSATGLTSNFNYVVRGEIDGLTMSTAGGSATVSVAAGAATDSTNVASMVLASAISKTTAAWAFGTGNGGLDTGAIANNTPYCVFLIMRPGTGVVDILISLSATAPTMPANYTYKRYIGGLRTDGSAQWIKFIQDGDFFQWDVPSLDVNATNPGTAAVLAPLALPNGVALTAIISVFLNNATTSNIAVLFSDPAMTDNAPNTTGNYSFVASTTGVLAISGGQFQVKTSTAQTIRYRLSASGANDLIKISTTGWIDRRGRDK